MTFDRSPFIVIWETTRACALACVHCRAEAVPYRDAEELTTEEGKALIDRVRAFGDPPPILVLTGGDPLRRPDIVELVGYAVSRGVPVSMTPSGTAAVTEAKLAALRDAGLARLAVSLDGATADVHDAFRGVRGSHAYTMRIIERARRLGLPLQINTTVSRRTVADLPALAEQMREFGVVLWALFFLVPVGRAQMEMALSAAEIEDVLRWAADLAVSAPFGVKTTEAPHYHRVLAERRALADRAGLAGRGGAGGADRPRGASTRRPLSRSHSEPSLRHPPSAGTGLFSPSGAAAPGEPVIATRAEPGAADRGVGRAGRAVTDGNGFVFIDHRGEICPSGFLPMPAGTIRRDDLVAVYRAAPLFVALRDPDRLRGRCGQCEYRHRCGGSRARAFAWSGDPLGEDPGCAYVPVCARSSHAIAGGSDAVTTAPVTESQVLDALRDVRDPEVNLTVVELGLIYGIAIDGGAVRVTMTLTTQGCPLHAVMTDWVREAVGKIPGVRDVDVVVTFDPPWSPDRIRA